MKRPLVLPACLLLLWTLTAFVSADDNADIRVVMKGSDKFQLVCPVPTSEGKWTWESGETNKDKLELEYKDENSGQYTCTYSKDNKKKHIYVKFRTCDNCIELDVASVMGIAVGDLVATVVIGVAIYLVASQARIRPTTAAQNKSSDRQRLVPSEMTGRASNDQYEQLRHKGQKETYDVINKR